MAVTLENRKINIKYSGGKKIQYRLMLTALRLAIKARGDTRGKRGFGGETRGKCGKVSDSEEERAVQRKEEGKLTDK